MVFWHQNAIRWCLFLTFKRSQEEVDIPAAGELTGLGELNHHQRSLRRLRRAGVGSSLVADVLVSGRGNRWRNEEINGEKHGKARRFQSCCWLEADRNGGLVLTILKPSDLGQHWPTILLGFVQALSTSKRTGSSGRIIRSGIWAVSILRVWVQ